MPSPIVGGDETSSYPQTAALMYDSPSRPQLPDGSGGAVGCSGVLIRDNVLLTAAHCGLDGEPFAAYFGPDPYGATGETVPISGFLTHPLFDPLDDGHIWHDIAVAPLQWGPAGVEPIPELELGVDELIGYWATHVGFGQAGSTGRSYRKRMASSVIIDWWFDLLITSPVDGSPCFGDSGGPAYVSAGGLPFVAGVVSFVYSPDCIGGDTASTLLDGHLDWLVEVAGPSPWEGPQPALDPPPELPPGDDDDSAPGDDDDSAPGDDDDSAAGDDDDSAPPETSGPAEAPPEDEDSEGTMFCSQGAVSTPTGQFGALALLLLLLVRWSRAHSRTWIRVPVPHS